MVSTFGIAASIWAVLLGALIFAVQGLLPFKQRHIPLLIGLTGAALWVGADWISSVACSSPSANLNCTAMSQVAGSKLIPLAILLALRNAQLRPKDVRL